MDENLKNLEEYLIQKYELVELNGAVKKKLANAFNSEVHVEPYHLLNLFKKMEDKLRQNRATNIAKGKKMEGISLLLYDLACILGIYPQYIRKINEIEKQNKEVREMKDFMSMASSVKSQPPKHEFSNVSDLVDEIFFSE